MSGSTSNERVRLKYRAHVEMGQSPPSSEYSRSPDDGLPFLQGTADFGPTSPVPRVYCGSLTKVAVPGDILFSVRAPVGELNLADQDAGIGRGLCAIRTHVSWHRRFGWWALHEARHQLNFVSTGSTYEAVATEDVANLLVETTVLGTQRAIADYLDRETARLDALVAAKKRVLGLLAEKRRALITRAVTRGLDPRALLRDSGIPWLGEIPAHWEIERARWLFAERDERSATGEEELLTVSHLTGVTPRSEKEVNMFEAETTEGYKLCRGSDLVINTLWAWMGAMGVSPVDGIVSPAYNVYQPGSRLDPGFVDALVRMPVFALEVTRYSKGVWSSRLRLYPEGFFEVLFPVPPMDEQRRIVSHIAMEARKLDAMRSATERTIALLKERRAALIAAAVTGKIDVEGAA
ncbi:MAG: restriction endonuclease subunit S [Acidobacteriota bacterium]